MEALLELATLLGPTVAAILTVPILDGIKRLVGVLDAAPAAVKQILAVCIAFGLTKLGALVDLQLPGDLSVWTGADVEALVSAAIAMAIHAGKRVPTPGVNIRSLTLVLFAAMPVAAACQTGRATVIVVDRSRLEVVVTPASYTGELGDTVTFAAVAIDTISGDTIPSVIRWNSTDESAVSIEPTTGHATLLRAGTYEVEAEVTQIVSMLIFRQLDDGTMQEVYVREREPIYAATGVVPDALHLEVGEEAYLCAYLLDGDGLRFRSQDFCPTWAPGMPPGPMPQQLELLPLEDVLRAGALVG